MLDLSKFDWVDIQRVHDEGMLFTDLPKYIGISRTALLRARKLGYIKHVIRKHTVLTEIEKKHMSDKLKAAHEEGRHPGWKHINQNPKYRSYPEIFFYEVLKHEGIVNKYSVVEQFQIGKYTLDFAVLELKLDIEIDGIQHVRNESAVEHDRIRDKYLNDNGWIVYRILWKELFTDTKLKIKELVDFINEGNVQNRYYDITPYLCERKHRTRKEYFDDVQRECDLKYENIIIQVQESNIDFSKFGWVNKVSDVIGIRHGKVKMWMMRHMSDFYNDKCFKKRARGVNG